MCCDNKPELAKKLYRKMTKGKTIFYKMYVIYETTEKNGDAKQILFSPFYRDELKTFGIIKSNCEVKDIKNSRKISREIERGIHVYLTLKDAENSRVVNSFSRFCYKIVKVKARAEDLLGCGGSDAVFTKIEITKSEFEKVMKEINKE